MASSRKKANSKVVLILLLLIIVILVGWYYLFYTPTTEHIEILKYDIESKQSEVDALNLQVAKQTKMLQDIDYLKTVNPAVPAYDNFKQIATVIDVILAQSSLFNVSFSQPQIAKDQSAPGVNTARRMLSVSFEAPTYQVAKDIIADIQDVPFRLQISNVSIGMVTSNIFNPDDLENETPHSLGDSPVRASLSITFFENKYSDV